MSVVAQAGDLHVSLNGSHVPPFASWPDAATNIPSALDLAVDGDTVWVTSGAYRLTTELIITNGVALVGVDGPTNTVIDGQYPLHTNRCVYIRHSNAVLNGFTIQGGYSKTSEAGGVLIDGAGTVRECIITSNRDYAALELKGGGYAEACLVVSNITGHGAGIYCFSGGVVSACVAIGNPRGGVACRYGGTIMNSTIRGNSSFYGGGVTLFYGGLLRGCLIEENIVSRNGAGIRIYGSGMVEDCVIRNNEAGWDLGHGGGIAIEGSGVIRNSLIYGNTAYYDGGGVIVFGTATVENCTIAANQADWYGGGIHFEGGGEILNSIVYGNIAPGSSNYTLGAAAAAYSCIAPLPVGGVGMTDEPPAFRGSDQGDYRLASSSPCIDAGTNLPWHAGATDVGGAPRNFNGVTDMGAYELGPAPAGIVTTGESIQISWYVGMGTVHQMQYAADLRSGVWFDYGDAATAMAAYVEVIVTNSDLSRAYRLVTP